MNGNVSIAIDQIIMCRISNKISRCQLNGKKRLHACNIVHLHGNGKTFETGCQKKKRFPFRKMSSFSNVLFKQKVTNKSPCVAYHQKRLLLQFANIRKSISSKLRPQDVIKKVHKKHPVLRTYVKN